MSFSYLVYGLNLRSDIPIPGLAASLHGEADLTVTLQTKPGGKEPDWAARANTLPVSDLIARPGEDEFGEPTFVLSALGGGEFFRLSYSDGTCFLLDGDFARLWGSCEPPMILEDLVTYLLGPVLGFVLRRRGKLALHASCTAVGNFAVAISGASEAGKSTMAGALALRGERILCEDICPVTEENGRYWVEPGYPRVCLWPDAVEKLLGSAEALPLLTPNWEKRYLPLDGSRAGFASRPLPLGAIYLLAPRTDEADAPRIERIDPRTALLELVQNTYMNFLLDRVQRAAEFDGLSRLVLRVPVRRLVPHRDPARLGAMCDLLWRDAATLLQVESVAAVRKG